MKLTPTMEVGDTVEFKMNITGKVSAVYNGSFSVDLCGVQHNYIGQSSFTWSDDLKRWVEK